MKSYGQNVDIPAALEKFTELAPADRRWRVNFLDHGKLSPTKTNDGSKCLTMPEIKGLDALKDICHRYLWECGYYLTSGVKYGCDWLAYDHPPHLVHAASREVPKGQCAAHVVQETASQACDPIIDWHVSFYYCTKGRIFTYFIKDIG